MKNRLLLPILLLVNLAVNAETIYVTDNLKLTLRSGPSPTSKIVQMLPSSTPLTVLKGDSNGYFKVQTPKGSKGYILSRHIQKNQTNSWHLKQATEELEHLRSENKQIKTELKSLKIQQGNEDSNDSTLSDQKDQLSQEPAKIQQIPDNSLQLKQQRDQLQERVVNAERNLQQLKRDKQTLEDSTNQTWFIYGGLVAFAGIFLGLITPRIGWRRKSRSWDTF